MPSGCGIFLSFHNKELDFPIFFFFFDVFFFCVFVCRSFVHSQPSQCYFCFETTFPTCRPLLLSDTMSGTSLWDRMTKASSQPSMSQSSGEAPPNDSPPPTESPRSIPSTPARSPQSSRGRLVHRKVCPLPSSTYPSHVFPFHLTFLTPVFFSLFLSIFKKKKKRFFLKRKRTKTVTKEPTQETRLRTANSEEQNQRGKRV